MSGGFVVLRTSRTGQRSLVTVDDAVERLLASGKHRNGRQMAGWLAEGREFATATATYRRATQAECDALATDAGQE